MAYLPDHLKKVSSLYIQSSRTIYEADIAQEVSRRLTEIGFSFDDERIRKEFYLTEMSVKIFPCVDQERREIHFYYRHLMIYSTIIKIS